MKKRIHQCHETGCLDTPYLGGYCRKHHGIRELKEQRRSAAVRLLHFSVVDDRIPDHPELKAELFKLQNYWRDACDVNIYRRGTKTMPLDEAPYATEWCIALAQEIVDAELAYRAGGQPASGLEYCQEWVWNRFNNLDKGLQSNGIERKPNR